MKVLVTGNKSGLGKYLHENFPNAMGWDRDTTEDEKEKIRKEGVDVLIHCASNPAREVTSESLFSYIQDNICLAKELAAIPHKKFIFISSVDVYPRNSEVHAEDDVIDVNAVEGIYAICKLASESIVREYSLNYLIMRCSAFLGPYARKNSLLKIKEDENPTVTLTPDSEFNYVLYQDVLKFLQVAMEKDLKGICNLAASKNITLSQAADMFGKKVTFGEFRYRVGNIDNAKVASLIPAFKKSSEEIIREFATL
ncbi:MAG: NAD-dependent epimerase/dehydratase family protein [Candidatus Wildermuthbacteria bacterium]|nr:NAD-dependent epimerase/dehydratase family protein [Candidatus Wildermuthbacteria bacterium]